MKWDIFTIKGEKNGEYDLPKYIFDVELNTDLVHQVLRAISLNRLTPVAHTKTKAEVSGGGKKPWKQKGTGRARHGSSRSPIWRKGGITFGPRNDRNYSVSINKKMKRKALFMMLSDFIISNKLYLVDDISISTPKTKDGIELLKNVVKSDTEKTLLVVSTKDYLVEKTFSNLQNVKVILANSLNVEDLLKYNSLIMTVPSIEVIKDTYKV